MPDDQRKLIRVGVDETGYGAIAGPITVCAAMIKPEWREELIARKPRDSKRMSPERRLKLAEWIAETRAADWVIVNEPAHVIDALSPWDAVCKGARTALIILAGQTGKDLSDFEIVMDGKTPLRGIPKGVVNRSKVGADDSILEVSIASVLAKVHRDFLMDELSSRYPVYRWDENKGYPVDEHYDALYHYGPMPEHRLNSGVRKGVRKYWERYHRDRNEPMPVWLEELQEHHRRKLRDPTMGPPGPRTTRI